MTQKQPVNAQAILGSVLNMLKQLKSNGGFQLALLIDNPAVFLKEIVDGFVNGQLDRET